MQSKKMSMLETICNVGSGFIIAWLVTIYLLPFMFQAFLGWEFWVTVLYTVISLGRTYIWRRFFNGRFQIG